MDENCDTGNVNPYETDALLSRYCEFHYGDSCLGVENFPARCARICMEMMSGRKMETALDVGCSVGRASFELARNFSVVTGIDSSRRFVDVASTFKKTGVLSYDFPCEGDLSVRKRRTLEEMGFEDDMRKRVEFSREDALSLPPQCADYNLIFAGNLIDRLWSPRRFLSSLHRRLVRGGLLVLTSPYTWLTEYTPRREWLGGFSRGDVNITTLDGLKTILLPHFGMLGAVLDIPFVIRETGRSYQYGISQMTVWERRG